MPAVSPRFSALQRAENSSIRHGVNQSPIDGMLFQCSSASRKFLNDRRGRAILAGTPKFQCSSASRKFLNETVAITAATEAASFSALQRAENSSIVVEKLCVQLLTRFQCSSASRKFLNAHWRTHWQAGVGVSVLFSEPKIPQYRRSRPRLRRGRSFSALQRAENSSITDARRILQHQQRVSVLFSEPKIPQCVLRAPVAEEYKGFSALQRAENSSMRLRQAPASHPSRVSVLFSEPKIPQSTNPTEPPRLTSAFQCSSASRKFLNSERPPERQRLAGVWFQCSSASRKFLNFVGAASDWSGSMFQCSSASRKFLNSISPNRRLISGASFSALQRAENSSIMRIRIESPFPIQFQCSSASRKFLN